MLVNDDGDRVHNDQSASAIIFASEVRNKWRVQFK